MRCICASSGRLGISMAGGRFAKRCQKLSVATFVTRHLKEGLTGFPALRVVTSLRHFRHLCHDDFALPASPPLNTFVSVDDYLDSGLQSDIRHGTVDGEVYAIGGASTSHGLIVEA
jgi:hypothetical protein